MQAHLQRLKDSELLASIKELVQRERALTTEVLRHLEEIERRKLYADLRCASLFEYAVRELGYSESAAGRRIQAMRLMREIPGVEDKIESGALNLSNICQAQSLFRDIKKSQPEKDLNTEEKKEILEKLEGKSAREGERILLTLSPPETLPRERERIVSSEHTELRFLVNQELQTKLTEVRALLGPKGAKLSLAELVMEMASLSSERLCEKRFGKARVARNSESSSITPDVGSESKGGRYVPRAVKHQVWQVAGGKCAACGSQHHLQFDHIHPVSLGGGSTPDNLQLLCSSCNLRRGIKTFGTRAMRRD